ncbi:MAG TPA: xylose isomerase [Planctomycetes bacterium]|nr:xylose isomerase [Planctomycetota bacterium]
MRSMSRREFVGTTLGAAALAAAPAVGAPPPEAAAPAAASPAEKKKLKISVLSYSFRGLLGEGKMDIFGYLESCKYRYGLGAADLWSGFLASTAEDYLKKVKEGLEERGLELADIAVDAAHVWDDDPAVREKNRANALAHLNAARLLGARFVRVDAGGRGAEWTQEAFDHIVACYREYARYAQEHGFKVGAENHWGPEQAWANMQKLYRAVDHPAFGVSCHIGGWAGDDAEKARADREAAPWILHTHIAWNITSGPLLEEKLANLWNVGYGGYYSVEHHSAVNEYAEVAIQLERVRAVLERFQAQGGTR